MPKTKKNRDLEMFKYKGIRGNSMIRKKAAYFLIFVLLFSISISFVDAKAGTCKNPNGGTYCNSKSQVSDCACDAACVAYGDCCDDYKEICDGPTASGKQPNPVSDNSNTPPIGWLDDANCNIIGGWALDLDTRSAAITVHIYKDGPAGSGTFVTAATTTGLRQDINNIYDNSSTVNTHGFTIATPDSLKDGKSHDIYIHGIDSTTPAAGPNPVLSGTPKKIQCEKDSCAGVVCNRPPSPVCYGNYSVLYSTNGICVQGFCRWTNTSTYCPYGCKDGACVKEAPKFNLSNYPSMFVKGDNFNGVLVVGDKAGNSDVLAMSDIISGLKNIAVGPVRFASEVNGIEQNILSVGGACANAITAQIEGYPQDCVNGLKPGTGKINLYTHNGYAHLVVKGYYDSDTLAAANVLANYKDYKLSGVEYTVNSPVQICTDSDADKEHPDGKDYYVKGTTTGPHSYYGVSSDTDMCSDSYLLKEFYCYYNDMSGMEIVTEENYQCPNGCKDGACIQDTSSCTKCAEVANGLTTPYFDPTRCHFMIFDGSYSYVSDGFGYTVVQCESNQFIGGVTHIDCPSYYTDNRVVVGSAWYDNLLPYLIQYTCANQVGNLNAPSQIFAYCCDVTASSGAAASKADVASTQKRHSISVDKKGKITIT